MPGEVLYFDKLVEISTDAIVLRNYYIPFGSSKRIPIDSIESIQVKEPTLLTGSWRLHGSGDFRVWFPLDPARPKRDKVFVVTIRNKKMRAGFTVENSETVLRILRDKGLVTQATA